MKLGKCSGHQIAVRRWFSKAFRKWDSRTRSTYNWIFAIKQGTNQAVYSSAPALTMRWQTDIDSIRRRLKNYSQLQTTLHPSLHFFLPLFPPYRGTLFRYLSLWRFSRTLSSLGAVIPVETFPELCKPFESSKYLGTRCTVSNPSPLIVVVVLSKSANARTTRTAGKAMLRQLRW